MPVFVLLLRGINVGSAQQMAMSELVAALADAGLPGARTHLRSGNVVVTASTAPSADALERAVRERTGVPARVLVLAASDFRTIVAEDPLLEIAEDPSKHVVTFLDAPPPADLPDPDVPEPEVVVVAERAIYQYSPLGISKSRLAPAWWKRLGPVATTRNRNTIVRLLAMIDEAEADEG